MKITVSTLCLTGDPGPQTAHAERYSQHTATPASSHNPNTMWPQRRESGRCYWGDWMWDGLEERVGVRLSTSSSTWTSLNPIRSPPPGPTTPHFHVLSQVWLCQACLASLLYLSHSYQPLTPDAGPPPAPKPSHCPGSKCSLRKHQGHTLLKGWETSDELGKAVLLGVWGAALQCRRQGCTHWLHDSRRIFLPVFLSHLCSRKEPYPQDHYSPFDF